jgi:hypothetical protein
LAAARKHALLALEETPRFRAAHMRLLEITRKLDAASRDGDSTSAPNKTDKRANKKPTGF